MFDVGFAELVVIGVVALVVIGPDKLPAVARFLGSMVGRAQRYVASVKAEINREISLEDIQKEFAEQAKRKILPPHQDSNSNQSKQ